MTDPRFDFTDWTDGYVQLVSQHPADHPLDPHDPVACIRSRRVRVRYRVVTHRRPNYWSRAIEVDRDAVLIVPETKPSGKAIGWGLFGCASNELLFYEPLFAMQPDDTVKIIRDRVAP